MRPDGLKHSEECFINASKIEFNLPYWHYDKKDDHSVEYAREWLKFRKMWEGEIDNHYNPEKRMRTVTEVGCICGAAHKTEQVPTP
jgi:hypothetical protein